MHENAIKKVTAKIEGSLKQCYIKDSWPEYESINTHVDLLSVELLKHKQEWLDSSDVYSIFYDLVYETIKERFGGAQLTGSLWDLLGEENGQTLKNLILNFYMSIPRSYEIYVPFPATTLELSSVELNDELSVVVFDDAKDVPGAHRTGLLSMFDSKLKPKKAYFRYRATGYCSGSTQNRTVRRAFSSLKIVFQQGIWKKLFSIVDREPEGLASLSGQYSIAKARVISVDKTASVERVVATELALDVSRLMNKLNINAAEKAISDAIENNKFSNILLGFLGLPALLVKNREPEADRIKSAIEWCFDSYATENATMAFLQVCFGLESLLGDETGNDSLTSTLADRCAYLVASDIKGRKSIRERFKELYTIRSKLVHGTTTWLDPDQRHLLHWGRSMLEYAISKEIKHLSMHI